MNEASKLAVVPKPPSTLEKAEPRTKRILSGMVSDLIGLAKKRAPAAIERDAAWLYQRGLDSYYGRGAPQDLAAAASFFRQSAAKGLAEAQYSLGVLLENGRGVTKDYVEAAKWYRLAAEQGHAEAQNNLGWMLGKGCGVPRDCVETVKWHRKAAEQGNAMAQVCLGLAYTVGEGVPKEPAQAALWFRKAAAQGYANAQYRLGRCCHKGEGVLQDYQEAVNWFRKGAVQGDLNAQAWLGQSYHDGQGVAKDDTEAANWFRKAAEQGHPYAQRMLGLAYLTGEGVPQDDLESYKWLRIAVELGCQDTTGALVVARSSYRDEELQDAERWVQELKTRFSNSTDARSNPAPQLEKLTSAPPPAPVIPVPKTILSSDARATALADLEERALRCTKCPHLAASRTHVVFGTGNVDAEVLFLGEAPGTDEDRQGQPFVGLAGQLLSKIISTMGLSRESVYLANILKCRPPGEAAASNRKPTPEELRACIPYLNKQIELVSPKVIVALGSTAMESLLGKSIRITELRGHWQTYGGILLMPTYHPAYLLRNWATSEKRKVWEDMLQVMQKLGLPISDRQGRYFLNDQATT